MTMQRKPQRNYHDAAKVALLLIAALALAYLLASGDFEPRSAAVPSSMAPAAPLEDDSQTMVQGDAKTKLSLEGYLPLNVSIVSPATVVMGSGCYAIRASTTEDQAISLNAALAKDLPARPLTHDLFIDVLGNFGIAVEFAAVDTYADNVYYSRLVLKKDNRILALDARPSDAMAVALRAGKPLYISKLLLESVGRKVC